MTGQAKKVRGTPIGAAPLYEDVMFLQGRCVVGSGSLFPKERGPDPLPQPPSPKRGRGHFCRQSWPFGGRDSSSHGKYSCLLQSDHTANLHAGISQIETGQPVFSYGTLVLVLAFDVVRHLHPYSGDVYQRISFALAWCPICPTQTLFSKFTVFLCRW